MSDRLEAAEAELRELRGVKDLVSANEAMQAEIRVLRQERDEWERTARAESDGLMRFRDRLRETEAALAQTHKDQDESMEYIRGLEDALADTWRALELLRRIRQWDALNPPPDPVPAPFGDLPYWIAEIDRALAATGGDTAQSVIDELAGTYDSLPNPDWKGTPA